jgi:phosphoribosylglycinamide formyltransferase-1
MNIGILASHEGTTLQAIIDARRGGALSADIGIVICNNAAAGALRRAGAAGLPTRHLSGRTHPDPGALAEAIATALIDARVELVFLAGYMKKLGSAVLDTFAGRIINTHPSLLPKYGGPGCYGRRVYEAVLAAGERETGVTIHGVTEHYDSGPILVQRRVPVLPGDTIQDLTARVQSVERVLVVEVLQEFATGVRTLPVSGLAP